jgi:hypothetical protein
MIHAAGMRRCPSSAPKARRTDSSLKPPTGSAGPGGRAHSKLPHRRQTASYVLVNNRYVYTFAEQRERRAGTTMDRQGRLLAIQGARFN